MKMRNNSKTKHVEKIAHRGGCSVDVLWIFGGILCACVWF